MSRRPQGKVTGPVTGRRGLCRPYGGACRVNLISPRSRGGRRSALRQGFPKGRRMTSAAEKWPGSPRAERNATPGPVGTRPRPTTPPAQDGEGRARARGLVVRGEPHDRVGNALPAVGQQQRQGPPRPAAGRRAAALGGGDGRRRRRGRREGLSRRCSPWRPAQGLPGSGGGDPLGYGELAPPAPSPPSSVASRESTEALVGGGHLRR